MDEHVPPSYNAYMELAGKIALVTGSARRVGKAIALALARAGCDVVVHYHASADAAAATAGEIRALGVRCLPIRADLAEPDQIAALFAAVRDAFSRLDVLVNSAAVFDRTPWATLSPEQWQAEMAVNALAPALCIRHAIELMPAGGAIVNITDISAERASAGYPAYCASKAALGALTRSAARALAGKNIRVNAVAPGAVEWPDGADEAHKAAVLRHVPMGRIGRPEDVAAAVVFLAGADYITGQTLRVDGGWHTG